MDTPDKNNKNTQEKENKQIPFILKMLHTPPLKKQTIDDYENFPKIQTVFEYAQKCLDNGRFKAAIKSFQDVIKTNPCAAAYNNLALAYMFQSQKEKAHDTFQKAHDLYPNAPLCTYNFATYFYYQNKLDKAISLFTSILKQEESSLDSTGKEEIDVIKKPTLNNLSCALFYQSQDKPETLKKAAEYLEQAHDPEKIYPLILVNLANIYAKQEKYDDAIKFYKQALDEDPLIADAYNGLGFAYCNTNNPDKGIKMFKRALYVDKNCQAALHNLKMLHYAMSQAQSQETPAQK